MSAASGTDADPWEPWLSALEEGVAAGDPGRAEAALEGLWRFPFHEERARSHARWDRLFAALLPLLAAPGRPRESALHYVWVVMGAEQGPPYDGHSPEMRARTVERRTAALLPLLAPGVREGTLSLLRLIDDLTHVEQLADVEPQSIVLDWLARVAPHPARALAARIAYLEGRADWEAAGTSVLDCLDHADGMVRAYAARALGGRAMEDPAGLPALVASLTAKELERPGIAGPFFSNWYTFGAPDFARDAGIDVEEWLCTILARRKGPEPDTLPCSNGIDFFAHEIFGGRPDFVQRLMAMGNPGLAVEAATEVDERVDGMAAPLLELAAHADAEVARLAVWHLARNHRLLAPDAESRGLACRRALAGGGELFVNLARDGDGRTNAYSATLYPADGATFDAGQAAAALEAVLPAAVRGERVRFGMPGDEGPGLYRLGRSGGARYAHGALIDYRGDVDAEVWETIRIVWHGRPGAWRPEAAP